MIVNQWWQLFDKNENKYYYYNVADQKTTWHRPDPSIRPEVQIEIIPLGSKLLSLIDQNGERTIDDILSKDSFVLSPLLLLSLKLADSHQQNSNNNNQIKSSGLNLDKLVEMTKAAAAISPSNNAETLTTNYEPILSVLSNFSNQMTSSTSSISLTNDQIKTPPTTTTTLTLKHKRQPRTNPNYISVVINNNNNNNGENLDGTLTKSHYIKIDNEASKSCYQFNKNSLKIEPQTPTPTATTTTNNNNSDKNILNLSSSTSHGSLLDSFLSIRRKKINSPTSPDESCFNCKSPPTSKSNKIKVKLFGGLKGQPKSTSSLNNTNNNNNNTIKNDHKTELEAKLSRRLDMLSMTSSSTTTLVDQNHQNIKQQSNLDNKMNERDLPLCYSASLCRKNSKKKQLKSFGNFFIFLFLKLN
jgi:hypothetical protein